MSEYERTPPVTAKEMHSRPRGEAVCGDCDPNESVAQYITRTASGAAMPNLGYATTHHLLTELRTRMEVDGINQSGIDAQFSVTFAAQLDYMLANLTLDQLTYRTVDE